MGADEIQAGLVKLRAYLEKRYEIRITELERLDRGVYRLDRKEGGSWVARIFSAKRPLERTKGDADILRFLEKEKFPAERCAAPEPVSNPGGWSVILTEFVDGIPLQRTETLLYTAGDMLGRLNSIPAEEGSMTREAGALHHYARAEGGPRNEIDAARSWLDEIESKVPPQKLAPFALLKQQLGHADDGRGLPKALIHPDPASVNFIVKPDGTATLIDWTGAGKGPRLGPLALLIWDSALGRQGQSVERVDHVVAGYSRHIRLTDEELERLGAVMRVRPLVFACWQYRRAIMAGKQPDGTEWWMPDEELVDRIAGRARKVFEDQED
jgi:Ser/Thr protein kinase RdoA (MazF antagonist)